MISAIDLGSYGFRKHEKGIGVRFQNANRYDNVIVNPHVSGIPHSGKSTASDKDRANMLNFPDGTMHFITTPSDDQTYIITYSYDEKTEKLQREKGFLY